MYVPVQPRSSRGASHSRGYVQPKVESVCRFTWWHGFIFAYITKTFANKKCVILPKSQVISEKPIFIVVTQGHSSKLRKYGQI